MLDSKLHKKYLSHSVFSLQRISTRHARKLLITWFEGFVMGAIFVFLIGWWLK